MFTGLVERVGRVESLAEEGPGVRLRVAVDFAEECKIGDSVAVDGCCLTVVDVTGSVLAFQAGTETLSRTTLGRLKENSAVNLERSLPADGRLGGHFVQGHVDGVGKVRSRTDDGEWTHLCIELDPRLADQLVEKGSVAVAGVSLTVVQSLADAFTVALVPHTLSATTLGGLQTGSLVNIETDLLGKYVQKMIDKVK